MVDFYEILASRVGNRNWVFSTENKALIRVDSTAIVRHTKISDCKSRSSMWRISGKEIRQGIPADWKIQDYLEKLNGLYYLRNADGCNGRRNLLPCAKGKDWHRKMFVICATFTAPASMFMLNRLKSDGKCLSRMTETVTCGS